MIGGFCKMSASLASGSLTQIILRDHTSNRAGAHGSTLAGGQIAFDTAGIFSLRHIRIGAIKAAKGCQRLPIRKKVKPPIGPSNQFYIIFGASIRSKGTAIIPVISSPNSLGWRAPRRVSHGLNPLRLGWILERL